MRPTLLLAFVLACVPRPEAPPADPSPSPTPEERAEEERAANERRIAEILRNDEQRRARLAPEVDAAQPRAPNADWCESDRAERRTHAAVHESNQRRVEAILRERRRYAEAHCRRVQEAIVERSLVEDREGYVRVQRDVAGRVPVWRCPKGAPPGIDGNSEVSAVGAVPEESFNIVVESRKNAQCLDINDVDGGTSTP